MYVCMYVYEYADGFQRQRIRPREPGRADQQGPVENRQRRRRHLPIHRKTCIYIRTFLGRTLTVAVAGTGSQEREAVQRDERADRRGVRRKTERHAQPVRGNRGDRGM